MSTARSIHAFWPRASAPLCLAIGVIVVVAALAPNRAAAQKQSGDPSDEEPVDFDDAAENYSEFWERALSPSAGTYEDLVAQAAALVGAASGSRGDPAKLGDARLLLSDAIASRPSSAAAYFWLGQLEMHRENFSACEAALASAKKNDPSFRAPPNRSRLPSGWQLDHDLGLCSALSGNLVSALERFESITNRHPNCQRKRSRSDCYTWQVPFRSGEILMALGRLEEAISTLSGVSKNVNSAPIQVMYTLAIALERDEQLTAARKLLSRALSRDRNLRLLSASDRRYIPATDELYYRGFARLERRELAHARLFFASFLTEAPDSPWRQRAQSQLEEASRGGAAAALLEVGGMNTKPARESLAKTYPQFLKCTAGFPTQLFEVRINLRFGTKTGRKPAAESRTVTIAHFDPLEKKRLSGEIIEVTRCLRDVGNRLPLPGPSGSSSSRSYIRFHVGAQDVSKLGAVKATSPDNSL